jgi:hypothetical protein
MKTQMSTKAGYLGIGVGLSLFLFVGLSRMSFLGGVVGMTLLSGSLHDPGYATSAIVLICMIAAVFASGVVIVGSTGSLAWMMGSVLDTGLQKLKGNRE